MFNFYSTYNFLYLRHYDVNDVNIFRSFSIQVKHGECSVCHGNKDNFYIHGE